MQLFDADDLMHGMIVTRKGLESHHHIEFEYHNNPKIVTSWFTANLCAYCAGSPGVEGFPDEHLSLEWKSVLPIYVNRAAEMVQFLSRGPGEGMLLPLSGEVGVRALIRPLLLLSIAHKILILRIHRHHHLVHL